MKDELKNLEHKDSVSLTGVFVFLIIFFLLMASFLVYLRYSNISPLYDFYHKNVANNFNLSEYFSASANTELNLSDSVKTADIKITEAQLSDTIGVTNETFPLKKATLKIDADGVKISGKTGNSIFGMKLDILLVPEVKDGKVTFSVKKIETLGVPAPAKVVDSLSPQIQSLFTNAIPASKDLRATGVRSMVGYLLVTVEKI